MITINWSTNRLSKKEKSLDIWISFNLILVGWKLLKFLRMMKNLIPLLILFISNILVCFLHPSVSFSYHPSSFCFLPLSSFILLYMCPLILYRSLFPPFLAFLTFLLFSFRYLIYLFSWSFSSLLFVSFLFLVSFPSFQQYSLAFINYIPFPFDSSSSSFSNIPFHFSFSFL